MHRRCFRGPRRGEERPRHGGQIRNGHLAGHWGHGAHAGLGASGKHSLLSPLTPPHVFSYIYVFLLRPNAFCPSSTLEQRSVIKLMGGYQVTKSRVREREREREGRTQWFER